MAEPGKTGQGAVVDKSGALLWLHLVKDKRFTTGATIPYLLGGLRIANGLPELASEDTSLEQLRRLLMSMRDDLSTPESIAIQHCSHIDAYVAAWHATPPTSRSRIASPSHPDRGLFRPAAIDGHHVDGFESLVNALWATHGEQILKGRFSRETVVNLSGKRKREWLTFDECEQDEREEIRRTLANPADRTRTA